MNLIEKLRNPTDGLRYNDGNGLLKEAADALERLTAELARAKEYHAAELADVTAERDALRAALHSISLASQNSGSTKEDMGLYARAAIQGAGK